MVGLNILFYMFVIQFALVGLMRGWRKEILVTFSGALALFIINLLVTYFPFFRLDSPSLSDTARFGVYAFIIIALAFFGYQTPRLVRAAGDRLARDRVADAMFGLVVGVANGWLIVGSIWYFMHQLGYPLQPGITPPTADTSLIDNLPQSIFLFQPPWLYLAVAIAFLVVMAAFV
jgi:Na+/proline symporter